MLVGPAGPFEPAGPFSSGPEPDPLPDQQERSPTMASSSPHIAADAATGTLVDTDGLSPAGTPRESRRRRRSSGVPGWWAFPGIAAVLALIYVPTLLGGFYAFTDWAGIGGWNWVGLENFRTIFQTKELLGSLYHTVFLAFGFLV